MDKSACFYVVFWIICFPSYYFFIIESHPLRYMSLISKMIRVIQTFKRHIFEQVTRIIVRRCINFHVARSYVSRNIFPIMGKIIFHTLERESLIIWKRNIYTTVRTINQPDFSSYFLITRQMENRFYKSLFNFACSVWYLTRRNVW